MPVVHSSDSLGWYFLLENTAFGKHVRAPLFQFSSVKMEPSHTLLQSFENARWLRNRVTQAPAVPCSPAPLPPQWHTHEYGTELGTMGRCPQYHFYPPSGSGRRIPSLAGPHPWREVEATPRVSEKWQRQVHSWLEVLTYLESCCYVSIIDTKVEDQQGKMKGVNTGSVEAVLFPPCSLGCLCLEPWDAT